MANKETRILKNNTLEELRQKSNEISLHLGDNEQLNALMADKTYNYTAAAGDVLFSGSDTSSPAKTARFEISPAHTVDNTGGYIILEGVSSLDSSYVAGATIYQGSSGTPSWTATIVSASTSKILVRDSSGTFSTSADLKVGSTPDTIANAKVIRIVIESFPVGIVRVYKNGTELTQGITAAGFHTANIRATIPQSGSPTLTNYTEGVTIYQGSEQTSQANVEANATFYGTLHSISDGVIRLKTFNGSLNAGTLIRALGSSDTITGAQHGALTAVDSTYGSYIQLTTPAAASDIIKIFSLDVVAAINELQDDIGTVESLTTAANDLVLALNEHDAELGTITAGAMGTTASTVSTAIAEHETQIGNVDITDISSSNDNITGALEQLHNEVGDVTSGNLGTSASNLTSAVREHEDQIGNENITSIDSGSNTITGALNQLHTEVGSLSLNTSGTDLTAAINEHEADIGNMTLTGLSASDLSAAVRELRAELGDHLIINDATGYSATTAADGITELQGDVGDVTSLDTNATADLVAAINELENVLRDDTTQRSGYVMGTNANNIISAINEFETVLRGTNSNYTLNTAAQNVRDAINEHETQIGNLVFGAGGPVDVANSTVLTGAINVLDAEIGSTSYTGADLTTAIKNTQDDILVAGSLTSLNTTNKFIVGAINETDASIFNSVGSDRRTLSSLSTADKTSIVDSINEIYADIHTAGSVTLGTDANFLVGAINEIEGVFDASTKEITAGSNAFNITSGIFTINSSGNINLDTGNNHIVLKDDGNEFGRFTHNGGQLQLKSGANQTFLTANNANVVFSGTVTAVGTSVFTNLDISGNVDIDGSLETDALSINGTTVTATALELNILDGATLSVTELNILDGATLTTSELNILDGVTSSTTELNILDGVTSSTAELNILDGVTSSTAELNILDGVTASAADINLIDGITNGTVIASKAVITDANKDVTGFRNVTLTGQLSSGSLNISGNFDTNGTLDVALGSTLRGAVNITDTTGSSSTTTGALKVAGGVGIGEDLYIAGDLFVQGTQTILNTDTLTIEDTLVLAGNNLSSEPTSGGFGLEVGPITSPSGVAAGVTGAHSIVYNYGYDNGVGATPRYGRWEADGSLILSTATLDTPKVEGADFGPADDLTFSAGAGLSESVSGFAVTYTNTDRGSVAAAALNIFSSVVPSAGTTATADNNSDALNLTAGTGISTTGSGDNIITIANTDLGSSQNIFKTFTINSTPSDNVVADSNSDTLNLRGLDAITLTSVPGTDTINIDHDNFGTAGTFGTTGTEDGGYIKSIIVNAQGHITGITADNFDNRYEASNPAWNLNVAGVLVDSISNGETVNFVANSGVALASGVSGSEGSETTTLTFTHADTSSVADLTSNNSGHTFIQDIDFDFDTFGHVTNATVGTGSVTIGDGITTAIQGAGISLSGDLTWSADQSAASNFTIAHADTSSQNSVNNSGRTYIQDITLDTYGHVTGIGVATETYVFTPPTYDGDDIDVDTGPLTGATVISDLDFNVTTNTFGHVTDANGTIATRNLTLSDLNFGGWDLHVNGTKQADILNNGIANWKNGNHIIATYDNGVSFDHDTFTSGGTYTGGSDNGIVIEGFHIDSFGHIRNVQTRDLDSRFDNYDQWRLQDNGDSTTQYGQVKKTEYVKFINGTNTTTTRGGSGTASDPHTIRVNFVDPGYLTSQKTATFEAVNSSGDGNDPILRHNDGSDNDVRFTDSGLVTVTYTNSGSINFHGASDNTDVDVSDANLRTRLAALNPGQGVVYIGDAGNDLDLRVRGNLRVEGTQTIMNTETVTTEDNAILLNSNATSTPTEDGGVELERGNLNNARVFWNEATDRWQHGIVGTMYNIPLPSEADITRFYIRDDSNSVATITKDEVLAIDGGTAIGTNFVTVNSGENDRLEISHSNITRSDPGAGSTTLAYSGTFSAVTGVTSDAQGHVTAVNTNQFTMPAGYTLLVATTSILGGIKLEDDTEVTIAAQTVSTTADRYYGIQLNNNDQAVVNVPWSDTNTFRTVQVQDGGSSSTTFHQLGDTEVLQLRAGTNVTLEPDTPNAGNVTINAAGYTLPLASSTTRGGVKIGYSENGKNYPVELSSEKMYVNVPWVNTEYTAGIGLTLSGTEFKANVDGQNSVAPNASSVVASRTYKVQVDASDNLVVNVPWTDADERYTFDCVQNVGSNDNPYLKVDGSTESPQYVQVIGGTNTTVTRVSDIAFRISSTDTDTNDFLNDVSTVDNGSDMILRHTMNNGTAHDVGITQSGIITLTPGTETFEIGAPGTNLSTDSNDDVSIEIASSTGNNVTLDAASTTLAGLMSSTDKTKLNGIATSAEVNQNAFSTFELGTYTAAGGGTDITANSTTTEMKLFFWANSFTTAVNNSTKVGTVRLNSDQTDNIYSVGRTGSGYLSMDTTNTGYADFNSGSTTEFRMTSSGTFHADGDVVAYSTTTNSDRKLKENIQKVEGALELVSQLDGVTFNWKKDGKASAGVIAQNVEEVLPSAVKDVETLNEDDTHKVVDYNQLSALFIEAIKELKEENKLLRAEIESLKDINS